MSLRARLTLLITSLVAAAVFTVAVIHLQGLLGSRIGQAVERSNAMAQIVKREVLSRASARMAALGETPADYDTRTTIWARAIAEDIEMPQLLTETLATSPGIVEISVLGPDDRILASSRAGLVGKAGRHREDLRRLAALNFAAQVMALRYSDAEYESIAVLGELGRRKAIFTIQVLTPISLLSEYMRGELLTTSRVMLLVLLLSSLVAYVTAQLAYRPLTRLSQAIDRIATGEPSSDERPFSTAREYALVQEKLRILGEQFRGAQAGAVDLRGSVQQLLAKMETATLLFDRKGRLTMSSPVAERMLARDRQELHNSSFEDLFPELPPHAFEARVRGLTVGSLRVDLDPLPGGGAMVRLSDPEGRQLLESQLSVSSRVAAISRLTSRVAHEIKNPLNAISLQFELLRALFGEKIPEARPRMDDLLAEIQRLDRVVRTFLDFTRPIQLESEAFDLRQVVQGLNSLIAVEAHAQGVEIACDVPGNEVVVRGDEALLRQAVLNVVRNAMEAMPNGGTLRMRVENDDDAVLVVEDTGVGIPAENREKIFQLYFSTKDQGSGIGLAMTFRAVQLHNGVLEVESEPGKGTSIRIRLPQMNRKEAVAV